MTLPPGAEQTIVRHTYQNHDHCVWTINVAAGFEQVGAAGGGSDCCPGRAARKVGWPGWGYRPTK